jgi:hypothetical protein
MKIFSSLFPVIFFFVCALAFLSTHLYAQTNIPIENPSFEEPGLEKIKGWDGECADPGWTGLLEDIPGWTSDEIPWDSGVETGYTPTDGLWTAFMMGGDSSVYQITDYVIKEGDVIELSVDARITWAATLVQMRLFYLDDTAAKVTLASDDWDLTEEMSNYQTAFEASANPAAIGHSLGVWFDNVSDSASWIGLDNAILTNYSTTGISDQRNNPSNFSLEQNYPNPFNPSTEIRYTLKHADVVYLAVYDLVGREVAVLADGLQSAGEHSAVFAGTGLTSGIYFYKLQAGNQVMTRKMTLAK